MDNPKDKRLFKELAVYGKHLADFHLMQSSELDSSVAKFQGTGDKRVDKIKYDKKGKCIYINKEQYFEGVENIRISKFASTASGKICWTKNRNKEKGKTTIYRIGGSSGLANNF